MNAQNTTMIEVNKRYLKIITSYLQNNHYQYQVMDFDDDKKSQIYISDL